MTITRYPARHVQNRSAAASPPYGAAEKQVLNLAAFDEAWKEIRSWPGYDATPLVGLPGMAAELGLRSVYQKDEGKRFGLMSFKALGGAYAVLRLLQRHMLEHHGLANITSADLLAGMHRDAAAEVTVAAATDGNHGRSVAWGASLFGCGCKIYLHQHVSDAREREIAKYGADIVRVGGNYDDSVRQCALDAEQYHWQLVADTTAGGGSDTAPKLVMQGYTVLVEEFLEQMAGSQLPTHVFVPGGVGGLASAVASHLSERLATRKPRIIVVEPNEADCIFRSIEVGALTASDASLDTFMACLSAGEVSPLAWPAIRTQIEDALALPDAAAQDTMRILADGVAGDPPVVAGESGVAAIAGAIAAALDPDLRSALELDENSVAVAIGSEGATDADTYEQVVGRPYGDVEAVA